MRLGVKLVILLVLLAGIAGAVYSLPRLLSTRDPDDSAGTDFSLLAPFQAGVAKAQVLVLHEGLPNAFGHQRELDHELATKPTERLHGWPFYQETLPVAEADARALRAVVVAADSFIPFRGHKACGGFHPDYCVEWRDGTEVYRVLVCFSCGEVKCYGPAGGVHCDMAGECRERLKQLLRQYRKNRPPVEE